MRILKPLLAVLLLAWPMISGVQAADIPGAATWYFHVDLAQMKAEGAGQDVYAWLRDEAFDDLKEEAGVDVEKELDRITAFSVPDQGPVLLFEGDISQQSKDRLMALVAAQGDIDPLEHAGKSYFRIGEGDDEERSFDLSDFESGIDSLEDGAWVSMALPKKVLIAASEAQMKLLLRNKGKVPGSGAHDGALLVLTAEKTLLQAGMNSAAFGDGDEDWNSNILRNTEQVAFLMAAVADKLAIEARLITTEPDMAASLASVVRGLISLAAFNDELDAEAIAMIQGTKVDVVGNSLTISLAVDPSLVVATLGD